MPTPIITLTPPNPTIFDNTPAGTVVATVTVTMSDASVFSGTLYFLDDDGGRFRLNGPTSGPGPYDLVTTGIGLPSASSIEHVSLWTTLSGPAPPPPPPPPAPPPAPPPPPPAPPPPPPAPPPPPPPTLRLFPSPTLLGLGYSVTRRLKGSTSVQPHASGREVRVGYWANPLYEWDLTFEVLRDFGRGTVPSELKRLEGFFLAAQGSLAGFPFEDSDDKDVIGQLLGTTDGNPVTDHLFVRTYGDPGYGATVTEPVGVVHILTNVYLDGIPQAPFTDYDIDLSAPYDQTIRFISAGAGHAITVDMTYHFWVRFAEDTLDFEKFSGPPGAAYWRVKKLTLKSLRG